MRADCLSKLFDAKRIHHNYLLEFHPDHSTCRYCRHITLCLASAPCGIFTLSQESILGSCVFKHEIELWERLPACHSDILCDYINDLILNVYCAFFCPFSMGSRCVELCFAISSRIAKKLPSFDDILERSSLLPRNGALS